MVCYSIYLNWIPCCKRLTRFEVHHYTVYCCRYFLCAFLVSSLCAITEQTHNFLFVSGMDGCFQHTTYPAYHAAQCASCRAFLCFHALMPYPAIKCTSLAMNGSTAMSLAFTHSFIKCIKIGLLCSSFGAVIISEALLSKTLVPIRFAMCNGFRY